MIHNVDSYTANISSQEHDLANCVHKHSGNRMDAEMKLSTTKQTVTVQPASEKVSLIDFMTINIKKLLGNGAHFLKGIWSEKADAGEKNVDSGVEKGAELQNGQQRNENLPAVNLKAMESVADIKIQKKAEAVQETERWKLSTAIPALKVKTGQARERFEAGKDAFFKRMKEMTKSRNNSFTESREEKPGQQEKKPEWFEMGNSHLLDSYDKNGEYTMLGNRQEGKGYSGSPIKENYSEKV